MLGTGGKFSELGHAIGSWRAGQESMKMRSGGCIQGTPHRSIDYFQHFQIKSPFVDGEIELEDRLIGASV